MRLIDAHDFWARLPRNAENITLADITEALGGTPTIDAEPVKHGYWVTKWNRYDKDGYVIQTRGRCSCCNQSSDVSDYCGNCGAKMYGEVDG